MRTAPDVNDERTENPFSDYPTTAEAVSENPFAAPQMDANLDLPYSAARVPPSAYAYTTVVFLLGSFAGLFVLSIVLLVVGRSLPAVIAIPVAIVGAIGIGAFGARRMHNRLAYIHRQKVHWEMEQLERAGESYWKMQ